MEPRAGILACRALRQAAWLPYRPARGDGKHDQDARRGGGAGTVADGADRLSNATADYRPDAAVAGLSQPPTAVHSAVGALPAAARAGEHGGTGGGPPTRWPGPDPPRPPPARAPVFPVSRDAN